MRTSNLRTFLVDRTLTLLLITAAVLAVAAVVYTVSTPYAEEPFTEFYIVGAEGKAADYTEVLRVGERGTVTVGIVNREGKETDYRVEVLLDGALQEMIGPIALTPDGVWEGEAGFVADSVGKDRKVEFLLYKGDDDTPYLSLHLFVDVREASVDEGFGEEICLG